MEPLRTRYSVAMKVDDLGDFASVTSNKHFSVREECVQDVGGSSKILTAFVWKSEAQAVAVAISFDRFTPHLMVKTREGHFSCVLELTPGAYTFKFLVDGEWRVNEEENNIISGPKGDRLHTLTVSSEIAETSLNRQVFNQEVINAMVQHKEEIPRATVTAMTMKYVQKKRAAKGFRFLRRPLEKIAGKGQSDKENENKRRGVGEASSERPEQPPMGQKDPKGNYVQAEENAQERQEVARAMFKRGMDDAALALYKVSMTIREENGLTMTPANAHCHAEMAMVFMKVSELKLAESHLRLALQIWIDAPHQNFAKEPRHRYGDMCHYLAVVLDRQKNHREASHLYTLANRVYTEYAKDVEPRKLEAAKKNMLNNARKLHKADIKSASTLRSSSTTG